jgi:hypothetical protein
MDHEMPSKWAALSLNLAVCLGLVGCGSDIEPGSHAMGGSGAAQFGTGGVAEPGTGGASGASGGAAECDDGLQVLAVESAPQATVIAVPDRAAVMAVIRGAAAPNSDIVLYRDLASLVPGGHPQSRRFTADDLGLSSLERLSEVKVFGNELFVATPEGVAIATLDDNAGGVRLSSPLVDNFYLAPGDGFLAVSSISEFAIATRTGEAWQWTSTLPFPDARRGRVIGSIGREVLISLDEQPANTVEDATSRFIPAELVRVSLEGQTVARYLTRGNAVAPMEKNGGLLFPELNSFWGSMKAALEWLEPGGDELRNLSDVPVISATDADDGAFATAVIDAGAAGELLYVANGETGLRRGPWSTDALELASVRGPWDGGFARSSGISSLASAGSVLVVPGVDQKLYFLKVCSEE